MGGHRLSEREEPASDPHGTTTSDAQEGLSPQPQRTSRLAKVLLAVAFVVVLALSVAAFVPVPYVILGPGPIANVLGSSDGTKLIQVTGHETYPTTGSLDFTTVSIAPGDPEENPSALAVLGALLRPSEEVVKHSDYFPKGTTSEQVRDENAAEMTGSQQEAVAVALTALGEPVTEKVLIAAFPEKSPAQQAGLKVGDQVISVDGTKITKVDDVRPAVTAKKPGETERVEVLRDGRTVTADVVTTDNNGTAALGVFLSVSFVFPFSVDIHAGDVGGPSAGMMFSLGVYDVLTPGALTGGQRIAGTGTIDDLGNVGPIGGIDHKLIGASRGGATWFLAPASNCDEVVGHVPRGLHVVKVSSFDQARAAVQDIAAKKTSGLAPCTATGK